MTEAKSFPLPSDLKVVPGAEGGEAMYPYFTRFQPEDDQRFWFYNSMHFPEPMPSFDRSPPRSPTPRSARNTRGHVPADRDGHRPPDHQRAGLHHRQPGDRPGRDRRAGRASRKRAGYYYANWDRLYDEWKERMRA